MYNDTNGSELGLHKSYDRGAADISNSPKSAGQRESERESRRSAALLSDGAEAGPGENTLRTVTETWRAVMTVRRVFLCSVMIAS